MADIPTPESLDAALKLMAPIISHEIRNPLAVIGNSSYFVKTKLEMLGVSEPKVTKHLGNIETELRHANGVLEEMLVYARMKDPALSSTPLVSIMADAVSDLEVPKGVKLDNKLGEKAPRALVDPELAARCLKHLVRNALEGAGAAGKVTVTAAAAKSSVVVTVADTGPGIPKEMAGRLFVPFQTTKPRGIGLGLAYVKKACERMGGTVESTPPGTANTAVKLTWKLAP